MPGQRRKITSVTELARYQVGHTAWWVILRPIGDLPDVGPEDIWMKKHHPKAYFGYGPGKAVWGKSQLPKLQHTDFANLVPLLISRFIVEPFAICDIIRSRDTGEFFYQNDQDEWMPESLLLDSKVAANRERLRVLRMVKKWIEDNS